MLSHIHACLVYSLSVPLDLPPTACTLHVVTCTCMSIHCLYIPLDPPPPSHYMHVHSMLVHGTCMCMYKYLTCMSSLFTTVQLSSWAALHSPKAYYMYGTLHVGIYMYSRCTTCMCIYMYAGLSLHYSMVQCVC